MADGVCKATEYVEAHSSMSLLDDQKERCVFLNKTIVADGYGGYITTYVDGVAFKAAIVLDDSIEAKTAMTAGVTGVYTIVTGKEMNLQYHDVFRRVSDGKIFRVTSDGDDKHTPKSAMLNMRNVSAEEWSLPNG